MKHVLARFRSACSYPRSRTADSYSGGIRVGRTPRHHRGRPQRSESETPIIDELLPGDLLRSGLEAVGRLDRETSGLIILTSDGQLNHRLSQPGSRVAPVPIILAYGKVVIGPYRESPKNLRADILLKLAVKGPHGASKKPQL